MQPIRYRSLLVLPLVLSCLPGCSGTGSMTQGGGTSGVIGGSAATGGSVAASGGAVTGGRAAASGGAVTGGRAAASGGAVTGGSVAASGGAVTGGRAAATGGAATGGRAAATGGAATGGRPPATGGVNAAGGGASSAGSTSVCSDASLVWKSANKTNYTSYPDPGSEECIEYNGCTWAGQFAACDGTKSEAWVAAHDIVAAFPDFQSLRLHDLCLRKGQKSIVVTVLDTCGDSDCSGCCTKNKGSADQLIDIESYTDARWGVPDGPIEWADLGPTKGSGCN